jgi:hypothetical protein
MTYKELHQKIVDTVENAFQGKARRKDGSFRPHLDRDDCEHIADIVFGVVGRSGLAIREIDEPHRSQGRENPSH